MTVAEQKIIRAHQTTAPVDITALATVFGLSVYERDNLPPGVSGMICRDASPESPSGYSIFVNANDSYRRQRFTIAHECAHYLLHRDKIGDGLTDDAMYRSDKMTTADEFAANNTAADLIMPRHLVLKCIAEGIDGYPELANHFAVSVPAMRVRVRYLMHLG